MRINLIYAKASNGVIGKDNTMPWHLPEDLAHFRRQTQGCPVIMGRKTWESLPPKFRPLPGRTNVVLSRDAVHGQSISAAGAVVCPSLPAAIEHCAKLPEHPSEVWIMGGAQVYVQALPLAQRVVVTEIHQPFEGDAYAPELGPEWQETAREEHTASSGLPFAFVTYEFNLKP